VTAKAKTAKLMKTASQFLPAPVRLVLQCFRVAAARRREAKRLVRTIAASEAPPILVLSMGKVGSMTVCRTLAGEASVVGSVVHIHLTVDIDRIRREQVRAGLLPVPQHLHISKRLLPILPGHHVRIITAVRDPIARHISAFFQDPNLRHRRIDRSGLRLYQGRLLGLPTEMNLLRSRITVDDAVRTLVAELESAEALKYNFGWFDSEVRQTFGVDVFAAPFDRQAGYTVIRTENTDVFVAQCEKLSALIPTAMTSFLNLAEPLKEVRSHVRHEVTGGSVYDSVVSAVELSRETCERIYSHRFVRHFYDDETIDEWIQKWTSSTNSRSGRIPRRA